MSKETIYDLIVIGGGPGGYVASIRASQLGLKVLCIEKRKNLGGTCLNVGCIPSKTLLHSSHLFEQTKNDLKDFGIDIQGKVNLNLKKMMNNKTDAVKKLTSGISHLYKKNQITYINAHAKIVGKNKVVANDEIYESKNIIISTGSIPAQVKNVEIDEKFIVSSSGALDFDNVPNKLAVVGGGYIGLELGSVWKRLGADVTVIEYADKIVPTMDNDISNIFFKTLQTQGINFSLNTAVIGAEIKNNKVEIITQSKDSNEKNTEIYDKVLIAVGRTPNTEGLGLENVGIDIEKNGFIKTDSHYSTTTKNIFAIGDVIEGPMLAHKASAEGHALAEKLAGNQLEVNYGCIPAVIYTEPEVAWVGPTEQELIKKHVKFNKGVFPFSANARGKTTGDTVGNIKILSHSSNDKIISTHIIGSHAGELISEAVTAIEAGLSAEDLSIICHAHPTLSESMKEAASLASIGKAIHF